MILFASFDVGGKVIIFFFGFQISVLIFAKSTTGFLFAKGIEHCLVVLMFSYGI